MLFTTHLAATLLASDALALSRPELIAALVAGAGVDLDHLIVNRKWRSDLRDAVRFRLRASGAVNQHSWIQEPLAGLTGGTVLGFLLHVFVPEMRWWVVPGALALHMLLDSAMRFAHEPLAPLSRWTYRGRLRSGTVGEIAVSVPLLALAVLLVWM